MVSGIGGSSVIQAGKILGSQAGFKAPAVFNAMKPTGPSVTGFSTRVFGRYAPMSRYAVRSFSTQGNGSIENDKILIFAIKNNPTMPLEERPGVLER